MNPSYCVYGSFTIIHKKWFVHDWNQYSQVLQKNIAILFILGSLLIFNMPAGVEMNTFDNQGYVTDENDNSNSGSKRGKNSVEASSSSKSSYLEGLSDEEKKSLKRGIMKNVVIISFAFMLLFTAFQSMANLQSSLNKVSNTVLQM